MYVFQIFDYYAASRTLLFVGVFECLAIGYFYGIKKYCRNLEKMWKTELGPWLKIMWMFVTPAFTLALIVAMVGTYHELTYNRTYKYPSWAIAFGWSLSISSVICIPIYAIYKLLTTKGSLSEVIIINQIIINKSIIQWYIWLFDIVYFNRYFI